MLESRIIGACPSTMNNGNSIPPTVLVPQGSKKAIWKSMRPPLDGIVIVVFILPSNTSIVEEPNQFSPCSRPHQLNDNSPSYGRPERECVILPAILISSPVCKMESFVMSPITYPVSSDIWSIEKSKSSENVHRFSKSKELVPSTSVTLILISPSSKVERSTSQLANRVTENIISLSTKL